MQKVKLKNGLTVIYEEKNTNSIAVEVLVKVGSNNETVKERGISHFIEHMIFEGTKKRSNSQEIANEIEKIGGELNAYTSNERTCFFIKVLNKHFDTLQYKFTPSRLFELCIECDNQVERLENLLLQ